MSAGSHRKPRSQRNPFPLMRPFLFLLIIASSLVAQEPLRLASEGRLWLKIPANQAPLRDVEVSTGSANPASWEKDPARRERHTDITFPIRWWDWREIAIAFTPTENGSVDLILDGPWEQKKPGTVFREEVLWDNLTAEGSTIENGNFETQVDGKPIAWRPVYGHSLAGDEWPLAQAHAIEGKFLAATSQSRPLAQTLTFTAGQKVTLRLHAKAAPLPDFVAPRCLGPNTPAHLALSKIKRGINLGNCWDAPPPYKWGIRYTPADIDRIAAEGFDHVRVPVAWAFHLRQGANGLEIDPALLADLEPVLHRALEKRLHVLLDWHHFHSLTDDPAAHQAEFVAGWQVIARHFQSWPPELFLELLNEPCNTLSTEIANPIYAKTISTIRAIDPQRILVVSPGKYGSPRELDKLHLPDGDDRLVVTVHCYDPFYFTHQGAAWVQLRDLHGIHYPGPPATPLAIPDSLKNNSAICNFIQRYNTLPADRNPCSARAVEELLDLAREWSAHFGRPIHLGEFGSHDVNDPSSRSRYAHDVRVLAETRHIPWALWDWKATFSYWDSAKNEARFRSALFD